MRAVHLDIVLDLSTETFLRCLKRFLVHGWVPYQFISDSSKTFKAGSWVLKSLFRNDTILQIHLAERSYKWTFNVEWAPWWGGVFERLVRSTKRCLRKVISRACFTLDELLTSLTEIEAIINLSLLSYIAARDTEEPLNPSHLLIGCRVIMLPNVWPQRWSIWHWLYAACSWQGEWNISMVPSTASRKDGGKNIMQNRERNTDTFLRNLLESLWCSWRQSLALFICRP